MEKLNQKSRSRSNNKKNKNKTKKMPHPQANNKVEDDFFDIINVSAAIESKLTINKFAKEKILDEKKVKEGIPEQHKFTTIKIQQMISNSVITSKGTKGHKFDKFKKVILIDFENLYNVIQRDMPTIFSIINTINTELVEQPVLFIFIMATYHRESNLFNLIIAQFKGAIAAEVIYTDRNVDDLSEPTCITKYGFNESDDYLLLKLFKYLAHFNIPVEILSADQYSYKMNIHIAYLYLSEDDRQTISARDPFNPYEYYMQFNKANIKAIKEAEAAAKAAAKAAAEAAAKAAAEAAAKARQNAINKVKHDRVPLFLYITGEKLSVRNSDIVYYSGGSQYNKLTKIVTYHNGLVGTFVDGNIYLTDSGIEFANGDIQLPDGRYVYSFGKILYQNGTIMYPVGTIQYLDGTLEYPNGTLEYPDGTIRHPY